MKIRASQMDALAAAVMDRARAERILALSQGGFEVREDSKSSVFTVHDAAGCSARIESRGLRARVISPEGRATEIEQYANGRIRRIIDPSGRKVSFERDPDGFLKSIDRGSEGGVYRFSLSPDWKPLRIEYPDETTSLTQYSPAGQPLQIVQRDGSEIHYEYGPDGRLTSLVDPQGNRTRLTDTGPGVSRLIEYPNGDRHVYVDDPDARVLSFDVNGKTHAHYHRHPKNNSVETRYKDGTVERFVFRNGRLIEAANEHSTVKLEYDDAGRLASEDTDGRVVRYQRNEVGALVGIVTPEGDTIRYARDLDQRLTGITDWNGNRYEISLPPSGPPSEIRYPNGLTVVTNANAMGLPSSWSVARSAEPRDRIDSASWEHDVCDRLVAATRDGRRQTYHYNKASRLVEVRSADHKLSERFELDSLGNRVRSEGAQCSYDSVNRLLRQGSRQFLYDGLGNQIADRNGQQTSTYTYDGRGQLVRIQMRGAVIEYAYDALGRRIRKRVGGATTRFQWAGTQLLSESTDDGNQVVRRDYLFCPEYLTPLAFREGSSVYYVHCGRLQEPLCVTDGHGQVVWKAEYLAFGRALISVERVRHPLRLPGQYHDDETGLHYAVARYYSPELGRFLSMDPHRVPGASLNYYTYCDGDPVNRVDPTGEISLTLGTVLIAVAVGVAVGAAIGAGVELYKQRNQEHTDWGQVGTAAIIGGCLGGIGAAVGAVATAATVGALGVIGAGAAAGGLGSAVQYCVQAGGQDHWDWSQFGTSVAVGAGIGAITAGIGGIIASRAAPATEEAAEIATAETEEVATQAAKPTGSEGAGDAAGTGDPFASGTTPKASEIENWAQEQGWTRSQTENGPIKYTDENGVVRATIKRGSPRTPGSENPHVELRNAQGERVDTQGNPVTRRSTGNHTPVDWDL